MKRLYQTKPYLILLLLFSLIIASCNGREETPSPAAELDPTIAPTETILVEPTVTQIPQTGKVVFISSPEPTFVSASLSEKIAVLAESSGLLFEQRATLQPAEIQQDWKIVILSNYDPAISELLNAAPGVQFIIYSEQDLGMAANLSVIRLRNEYQAFIAGYLSILITPDWRVGGIFSPDEAGSLAAEAYLAGGHFYCGICNSVYSPIVRFPVTTRLAADIDEAIWRPEIDALLTNILYGLYVAPEANNPDMLVDLVQRGLVLVGGQPPPDELRSRWAATIALDYLSPLEKIWPLVVSGQGDNTLDTPVVIQDINEEFYSPGRQRLVEQTLTDLEAGWIYPFEVP